MIRAPRLQYILQAFMNDRYADCIGMLHRALNEIQDESVRRRLRVNIALCEAKQRGKLYSGNNCYRSALLKEFPQVLCSSFFWETHCW
ncbi:unnamed protein product [Gongylonema pulchrum]|uniref:FAT domain-containing protein n=1 Tax=Gongylonema pulchrum TaxID=637853 RepID=A0A183EWA0_9BILA|nr:unnamed protein product [Gongylonema pulchrum]